MVDLLVGATVVNLLLEGRRRLPNLLVRSVVVVVGSVVVVVVASVVVVVSVTVAVLSVCKIGQQYEQYFGNLRSAVIVNIHVYLIE